MKSTVVNIHKEPYDVYIGRGSMWGNPFPITKHRTREEVLVLYKIYIQRMLRHSAHARAELRKLEGKRLGCYCKPKACHGDILKEIIDGRHKAT
jgi:hypothetical protein